jgi:GT2 family glycosyltransferase
MAFWQKKSNSKTWELDQFPAQALKTRAQGMNSIPPNKTIYIVIPVHNRKEKTESCLKCLSRQSYTNSCIIVIDDGSTDGTSEMINKQFPDVVVLKGDGNLWWTEATNRGCKYAMEKGAKLVLTLNDDVLIKENYLEKMSEAHSQAPQSIIGSLHLSQEAHPRILFAGVISHSRVTGKSVRNWYYYEMFEGQYRGLLPTGVLPGRGTLIPRDVFESIGYFDAKRFPQYKADFEFSHRARTAGFLLYVNAESPVFSAVDGGDELNERGESDDFSSFFRSFFESKSHNYLLDTWRYSAATYPKNSLLRLYLPVYFMIMVLRKWGSFLKRKLQ